MSAHQRYTPRVEVYQPAGAPESWTYTLDGRLSEQLYATRRLAGLEGRQEANRIGFERRRETPTGIVRGERDATPAPRSGALPVAGLGQITPLWRPKNRRWARR